jgi:glycosyltransferase-like protein
VRIALLTYSTRPRGGVVHTLALAEALAKLGEDVHVWTLGRGGDTTFFRPVDPAVTVHAVPFHAPADEPVGERILRSIDVLRDAFAPARTDYDIVHAQDCISANAALPCLRTIHHLDDFTTPELARCHERAVVEPSAHICVSASVADEVRQRWGLAPTVIPNGVDVDRFAAATGDVTGRQRWRDELGRYVLALGGIEPRKASIDLLAAFALLHPHHPDLRLVIGGGETLFDYRDYRATFETRAAKLGVEPVVTGVLEEDALPTLVAEASALAMVSTKEGFGLAAMESLAAGVPVVARDLPVLREVLAGAGDSVAFAENVPDIATALHRQLTHRPDPTAGRRLAATYTWHRAAAAHRDFYTTHLAPRGWDRAGAVASAE